MPLLNVDGVDVAVRCFGNGPDLVLLHGIISDGRAWEPQFELQDSFRLVVWDAPGCGESSDPPDSWRFPDFADCLATVLDRLAVTEPIIVGLSLGAVLAVEFGVRDRGVAAGLVLASGYAGWAGSLTPRDCAARLAACVEQSHLPPDEVVDRWMPGLFTPSTDPSSVATYRTIMADLHPAGLRTMAHALAEADLRPDLAKIDVPTLLVYGDADTRAPYETVGRALAAAIPGAETLVLTAAGHVCNVEQPEAFNDAVRRFATTVLAR